MTTWRLEQMYSLLLSFEYLILGMTATPYLGILLNLSGRFSA